MCVAFKKQWCCFAEDIEDVDFTIYHLRGGSFARTITPAPRLSRRYGTDADIEIAEVCRGLEGGSSKGDIFSALGEGDLTGHEARQSVQRTSTATSPFDGVR